MREIRLKTHLIVQSALAQAQNEGVSAMVVRRGDSDAGALAVKVNPLNGEPCQVLTQARNMEGDLGWRRRYAPDREADALLAQEAEWDRDLWIIEIEDKQGRRFVDGPIVEDEPPS